MKKTIFRTIVLLIVAGLVGFLIFFWYVNIQDVKSPGRKLADSLAKNPGISNAVRLPDGTYVSNKKN